MTQSKKGTKFILAIAVALLVPLFCFLFVSRMSKGKVIMPKHYVIDKVQEKTEGGRQIPDTIYHTVADITLINQVGHAVSLNKDLAGKMLVVDFIFTSCTSTCPQLSKHMQLLQTSFKKDNRKEASLDTIVQFISITVDPAHDSFPTLRAYADRYNANPDHWWFLTGDKKSIYNYARNELGVLTGPGNDGAEDFLHSDKIVLIDRSRQVRGYYDGTDVVQVRKCADDIVLLTLEKPKGEKFNLPK